MAAIFRSAVSVGQSGQSTLSITLPNNVQAGDLIILCVQYSGFLNSPGYVPDGAGWTYDHPLTFSVNNLSTMFYTRIAVAGDASKTYTVTSTVGQSNTNLTAIIYGTPLSQAFDQSVNPVTNSPGGGGDPNWHSGVVTPSIGGLECVYVVVTAASGVVPGTPPGATLRVTGRDGAAGQSQATTIAVFDRPVSGGAQGVMTGTLSQSYQYAANSMVVKGPGGGPSMLI